MALLAGEKGMTFKKNAVLVEFSSPHGQGGTFYRSGPHPVVNVQPDYNILLFLTGERIFRARSFRSAFLHLNIYWNYLVFSSFFRLVVVYNAFRLYFSLYARAEQYKPGNSQKLFTSLQLLIGFLQIKDNVQLTPLLNE